MALSFEESKKQLSEQATATTPMLMSLSDDTVMLAATTENWQKPRNSSIYTYYNDEYHDDSISTVDSNKNITLSETQINITQEKNSQYIPFEIPRYYDGFDLSKTELSIYWVNKNGSGSTSLPVDVYYSDDKIRFAWLVDDYDTVELIEIDEYEYKQLKMLTLRDPNQIIDEFVLSLVEGGIL